MIQTKAKKWKVTIERDNKFTYFKSNSELALFLKLKSSSITTLKNQCKRLGYILKFSDGTEIKPEYPDPDSHRMKLERGKKYKGDYIIYENNII